MKTPTIVLFLILLITSCNSEDQIENGSKNSEDYKEYYFDFDKIEHFHVHTHNSIRLSGAKDTLTEDDYKLLSGLVDFNIPSSLSDTFFLSKIEEIGFTKREISETKNDSINELFRRKAFDMNYSFSPCMPIFRDILIFRKQHELVGIAKICFQCKYITVHGTEVDTKFFGSFDGYEKLFKLLN